MADALDPAGVHDLVHAHDGTWRGYREQMATTKAAYLTEYWQNTAARKNVAALDGSEVEVNRLRGAVNTVEAALYPRANRLIVGPDVTGRGNPAYGRLVGNQWLGPVANQQRVLGAIRMALLYRGAGFKVGYEPGTASAVRRTFLRAIPPWEMVLDRDASDIGDERYRGHAYWSNVRDVERKYPRLKGTLKPSKREDFLPVVRGTGGAYTPMPLPDRLRVTSGDSQFVRVLEFCNLVDSCKGKRGADYLGRLEVYVLEQGDVSKSPVFVGPLPLADADNIGLPHIEPMLFGHEPEYPYRAVAWVAHLMPQVRELNLLRTKFGDMIRRFARKFAYQDGAFTDEALRKFASSADYEGIPFDGEVVKDIRQALMAIESLRIPPEFLQYMGTTEQDLERGIGVSPNARGIITKSTAFEAQTAQLYTESDLGKLAGMKDDAVLRVAKLGLRAIVAAMQDTGDSAGGDDPDHLAPVGGENTGEGDVAREMADALGADLAGSLAPLVDRRAVPSVGRDEGRVVQGTLVVVDEGKPCRVTVADLDASFELSLVEGGRTPLNDATMLQVLGGLMGGPYFAAWKAVQEGGPAAVFGRAFMEAYAERAELPRDLRVEHMEAKMVEETKKAAPVAAVPAVPASEPAPASAPSPSSSIDTVLAGLVAQAEAAGAEPVVALLKDASTAVAAGDLDGLRRALADALALVPPGADDLRASLERVAAALAPTPAESPPAESPPVPE